jgi:hypothetical protein
MSNLRQELRRAVRVLGGPHRTGKLANVGRTKLEYWLYENTPYWAKIEVERILELAADPRNWKGDLNGQAQTRKGKAKSKTRH